MVRLLAFGSYAYQSVTAIALIFAISHILSPANYTVFSLALASSQLLCVLMFEWLQLAGVRFLAPATGSDAVRLRSSLFSAAGLSALALVLVGSLLSLFAGLPLELTFLGLALAAAQGVTDLHFMMIRVSGRLGAAAMLLIGRATLLLAGAIAGAMVFGNATATLAGLVVGQMIALLLGSLADRSLLQWRPRLTARADLAGFCRYGMLAAAASVLHLAVPVMIRFIVVGRLGSAGPAAAAGFSMALDLLQRPFTVLVSAIHTVNYPDVVVRFDRGSDRDARQTTARLFDFIICSTAIMLGGLIGFLPDVARLFVPHDILASFLSAAPAAAAFYFLHLHLQGTLAILPHLQKSALRLVVVAAGQLLAVLACSGLAAAAGIRPPGIVAAAAVATAIVMLLASGPTIRFGAVPRLLLVAAAVVAAIAIGSLSMLPSEPSIWLLGKSTFAMMAVALIAWRGEFLTAPRQMEAGE
ncbi:MAG: hypothetical protein Q8M18_03110 [Bradyrhizobium sp.]|nr:hypothetical protein [Bradyrhizobium sp.]